MSTISEPAVVSAAIVTGAVADRRCRLLRWPPAPAASDGACAGGDAELKQLTADALAAPVRWADGVPAPTWRTLLHPAPHFDPLKNPGRCPGGSVRAYAAGKLVFRPGQEEKYRRAPSRPGWLERPHCAALSVRP
jgi:hypothetical protein